MVPPPEPEALKHEGSWSGAGAPTGCEVMRPVRLQGANGLSHGSKGDAMTVSRRDQNWLDRLPESLQGCALADTLEVVVALDLEVLREVELSRG